MAQPRPDGRTRNLCLRVITAAVLAPPVLAAVYFGNPWFESLVTLAAAVMMWEWIRVCSNGEFGLQGLGLVAGLLIAVAAGHLFDYRAALAALAALGCVAVLSSWRSDRTRGLFLALGVLLVGMFAIAFPYLRDEPSFGRYLTIWLVCGVWATDIGAYIIGKTVGGPKLAPRISPNKTWAGLAGGVAFASIWSIAWLSVPGGPQIYWTVAGGVAIALLAQGGDLSVSVLKRRYGVKDTSGLIPGHGGLLDRLDGMLLPAVSIVLVNGWL